MIRIIIWIASLVTALTGAAKGADGIASQYDRSSGPKVACGGKLNGSALTAAHRTLPCGTRVRIENKQNGRSVTVTVRISNRASSTSLRARRMLSVSVGSRGSLSRPNNSGPTEGITRLV
jgi:rare lipoprotein A